MVPVHLGAGIDGDVIGKDRSGEKMSLLLERALPGFQWVTQVKG
jgi:uncharacterized protein YgiM (DUF1202 family)